MRYISMTNSKMIIKLILTVAARKKAQGFHFLESFGGNHDDPGRLFKQVEHQVR